MTKEAEVYAVCGSVGHSSSREEFNEVVVGDTLLGQEIMSVERYPAVAAMPSPDRDAVAPSSNQSLSPEKNRSAEMGHEADVDTSQSSRPGAYPVQQRAIGARPGWAGRRLSLFRSRRNVEHHQVPPEMRVVDNNIPPETRMAPEQSVNTGVATESHDANNSVVMQGNQDGETNSPGATGKDEPSGRRRMLITVAIIALVLIAVGIGVGLAVGGGNKDDEKAMATNDEEEADPVVQVAADIYKPMLLEFSNEDEFLDPESPQSQALKWLSDSAPLDPTTGKSPITPSHRILTRYALAVLYYSTGGPEWIDQLGFLAKDTHECDWNIELPGTVETDTLNVTLLRKGVICDESENPEDRQIRILYFDTNNLSGRLPSTELATFQNLGIAIFSHNFLSGPMPTRWDFHSLVYLSISRNQLSSTIPSTLWTEATNLSRLYLTSNSLTGAVPLTIGKATNLKTLFLGENQLEGNLPETIGQLTALEHLELQSNKFMGSIPRSIGRMQMLSQISLNTNGFTGQFPWQDFAIRSDCALTELVLSSNSLSGTVPWEILGNTSSVGWACLQKLSLRSCGLDSGTLPVSLFDKWAGSLRELDLRGSSLQGSLPDAISKLSVLEYLDVGSNNLGGTIPDTMTSMTALRQFSIDYNFFIGPIPNNVGNMTSLTRIDWMSNQLTGTIPESLGNLSSLELLHLSENKFTGTVPTILANLTNLNTLTLSTNQVEGSMEFLCDTVQKFILLTADCVQEVQCGCCTNCTRS